MGLREIFKERGRLARLRQDRHAESLSAWEAKLRELGLEHPYAFADEHAEQFLQLANYRDVGMGHGCTPSAVFLYRVCGVGSLVDHSEWGTRIDRYEEKRRIHKLLLLERAREGPWLPLVNYCSGQLSGRRGFTWWSSLDLFPRDYQRAASRAGIPNDWVSTLPVVLRVRVDKLPDMVRVPTVLNAFDSPVFDPTPDRPEPIAGNTITLENRSWLARGCDEYVLPPIPVSVIEMLPIDSPQEDSSFGLSTGATLWGLLRDYHVRQTL